MFLEDVLKKDKKWRNIAYMLCGCRELADDIVQDMYLKILPYNKQYKDGYIFNTIRSVFVDYIRKQEEKVSIESLYYLKSRDSVFEPDDVEQTYLERFRQLDWKEQEIIIESYEKSIREIQKEVPYVSYFFVYKTMTEGIKKVLKDDYHKYQNSNLKYLKNGEN